MIPRVSTRGHSFKGAGAYYLHDKEADTSERVGWTYTHNLPTNDAEKAMKIMAFTAMHSDQLKRQSGVRLTGRKSELGEVYAFSLGWNPEQEPSKEEMLESSFDTLDKLGLSEHQAVMVYHQETDHPHVHVICNLVHPTNGKMAKVYNDYLVLSEWAENKEREDGKIYCEERVINNKLRNGIEPEPQELSKRDQKREERKKRIALVQTLYSHSDSGKAFASALEQNDLTLAQGDRRGFVLVDRAGEIYSVSRMLKGTSNAQLKQRLSDLELLPKAKDLSEERRYFDRDQYETDRQKSIVDNAIKEEREKPSKRDDNQISGATLARIQDKMMKARIEYDRKASRKLKDKKQELDKFYDRSGIEKRITDLKSKIKDLEKKGRINSKHFHGLKDKLHFAQNELKHVDWRTEEQLGKIRKQNEAERPEKFDERKIKQELSKKFSSKRGGGQSRHRDRNDKNNSYDLDR